MRGALILLSLLVFAPAARAEDPQAALDAAKAQWAAYDTDDYSYAVRQGCFCPPIVNVPRSVIVVDGAATNATTYDADYSSVEKLFGVVQNAIDRGSGLSVAYGDHGVPASISVDPIKEAVDDEYGISVTGFAAGRVQADPAILDGSAQRALDRARVRWANAGFVDYDFRVSLGCFCPVNVTRPHTLNIRNGAAENANRYNRAYSTVPKLFDTVQNAINRHFDGLTVKYGKTGLPRTISMDPSKNTVDEERSVSASRLRKA